MTFLSSLKPLKTGEIRLTDGELFNFKNYFLKIKKDILKIYLEILLMISIYSISATKKGFIIVKGTLILDVSITFEGTLIFSNCFEKIFL